MHGFTRTVLGQLDAMIGALRAKASIVTRSGHARRAPPAEQRRALQQGDSLYEARLLKRHLFLRIPLATLERVLRQAPSLRTFAQL